MPFSIRMRLRKQERERIHQEERNNARRKNAEEEEEVKRREEEDSPSQKAERSRLQSRREEEERVRTWRAASVLPRNIIQVLESTPRNKIWLSDQQEISFSNTFKACVENYTELQWNWWPFEPRMRPLQKDESRLYWRCGCGTRLWKEVSCKEAELIFPMLPHLDKVPRRPHRCREKRDRVSWKTLCGNTPTKVHGPTSSAGQRYTPSSNTIPTFCTSQGSQATSPSPNNGSNSGQAHNHGTPSSSQHFTATSANPASVADLWVLFGVQGSRRVLEIEHIKIHGQMNDSGFYRSLREHYRANRGRLKLWLSPWRLYNCEVVKFKRLAPNWTIKDRKDMPLDQGYIYQPRPPDAINPPIHPHEFHMHIYARICERQCRWQLFHNCMPELDDTFVLDAIPKKDEEFDTTSLGPKYSYMWGLEAKHEISAAYVALYHCVIFAIPFALWGWWMRRHPDDLQGAAVPATVIFTLISLFWSVNALCPQWRDDADYAGRG